MAEILRGNERGVECHIHQFCNDWFMVTLVDGRSKIVSPTSLQLTADESLTVWDAMMDGKAGMMNIEFTLDLVTGRFRRISRR